ncbi:MAG: fibronectin type III domain-containing protein, partial [Candidatus Eisenbacteria bacterium]|nr:fibronectin type III domain-containing protein [Candidatus Eisenbacteria bacterium]
MSGRARLLVRRMVRSGVVLGAALVAGACGDDGGTRPGGDDLSAPAAIRDLDVVSVTETGVTIHWTSPGDDGAIGTADRYDLRYGTDPIDEVSFAAATAA